MWAHFNFGSVDNMAIFFDNLWDLLDLSQEKKLLGMVYKCPIGSREGMNNFFFLKVFL